MVSGKIHSPTHDDYDSPKKGCNCIKCCNARIGYEFYTKDYIEAGNIRTTLVHIASVNLSDPVLERKYESKFQKWKKSLKSEKKDESITKAFQKRGKGNPRKGIIRIYN